MLFFEKKRQPIRVAAENNMHRVVGSIGPYEADIISCGIPKEVESMVPRAVSLISTNDCPKKAHNSLRVIYEKPNKTKESFAVCLKAFRLTVNDLSLRLIEWLELLRILGFSKVFVYFFSIHPNMERVLKYYQKIVIIF